MQIRLGGDLALFKVSAGCWWRPTTTRPGTVIDREFIAAHCHGFDDYLADARSVDIDTVVEATGIERLS